jgi:hypothetical protein
MKILLKRFFTAIAMLVALSTYVRADMQEVTAFIDQLDLGNNTIMVSDVQMAVTNFTVVQLASDSETTRRPLTSLSVGQEVRITFDYAHNRINTIEKIVILSN